MLKRTKYWPKLCIAAKVLVVNSIVFLKGVKYLKKLDKVMLHKILGRLFIAAKFTSKISLSFLSLSLSSFKLFPT